MKLDLLDSANISAWKLFIESRSSLKIKDDMIWYQKKWYKKNHGIIPKEYAYTFILVDEMLSAEKVSLINELLYDQLLLGASIFARGAFADVSSILHGNDFTYQMFTVAFNAGASFKEVSTVDMHALLPYESKEDQSHVPTPKPINVIDDPWSSPLYEDEYDLFSEQPLKAKKMPPPPFPKKFSADEFSINWEKTTISLNDGKGKKLTNREKGLLTLLVEKINFAGLRIGAHLNENWNTNISDSDGMFVSQGVLDRISKIEYNRTSYDYGLYGHSITIYWKELFGKGMEKIPSGGTPSAYVQDQLHRYHHISDKSIKICLYSTKEQAVFEKFYSKHKVVNWRPSYEYSKSEVVNALKLMAKNFDWLFFDISSDKKSTKYSKDKDVINWGAVPMATTSFTTTYS